MEMEELVMRCLGLLSGGDAEGDKDGSWESGGGGGGIRRRRSGGVVLAVVAEEEAKGREIGA